MRWREWACQSRSDDDSYAPHGVLLGREGLLDELQDVP